MLLLYANPGTASNGAFVLGPKRLSAIGEDRRRADLLNQFPAQRVRHSLEPVVRAELLIDVVKVIS